MEADATNLSTARQIGPKIEALYLALMPNSTSGPDLLQIAECLQIVEEHVPVAECGEDNAVISELVQDCRKKAAPVIRTPFNDSLRSVIALTRKKLIAKIGRSEPANGMATYSHGERHFHLLMELLGGWSNSMLEISGLGLSLHTFHAVVQPLHLRVVDCALECFAQFKKDKKLDTWHERVMNGTATKGESNGSKPSGDSLEFTYDAKEVATDSSSAFSIITLDSLVAQVAAMREVVGKYYSFLDNFSIVLNDKPAISLYPTDELRQWSELDMIYISLESGYLTHAVKDALMETQLVQVQTGIYVPQFVEDMFFIFARVLVRSISTSVESVLLAIAMKIVLYIDADCMVGDINPSTSGSIYKILQSKQCFLHSFRTLAIHKLSIEKPKEKVLKRDICKDAIGTIGSPSEKTASGTSSIVGVSLHADRKQITVDTKGTEAQTAQFKAVIGDELGEELAGLVQLTGLDKLVTKAGNSGWFSALSSMASTAAAATEAATSGLTERVQLAIKSDTAEAPKSGGGRGNLLEALIAGVEADAGLDSSDAAGVAGLSPSAKDSTATQRAIENSTSSDLDPLIFYREYYLARDGTYRSLLSAFNTVAEVVASEDITTYTRLYNTPKDAADGSMQANPYRLSLPDWAVAFNAMTATISSVLNLERVYESSMLTMTQPGQANWSNSPFRSESAIQQQQQQAHGALSMILSELRRVRALYDQLLQYDIQRLFWESFERHVAEPISVYVRARKNVRKVNVNVAMTGPTSSSSVNLGADVSINHVPTTTNGSGSHQQRCHIVYTCTNYEVDGEAMEARSTNSTIIGLVHAFIYNEAADVLYQSNLCTTAAGVSNSHALGSKSREASVRTVALFSNANITDKLDTETEDKKRGKVSLLSYYLRPYCSSATYVTILHMFASFLHKHLLYETMVYMQFSEWGALLFHKEIYACLHAFEKAVNAVNVLEIENYGTACNSPSKSVGRTGSGELNGIRSLFNPLIWILKLLTLDRLGDVVRYKIPSNAFALYDQDMVAIVDLLDSRANSTPLTPISKTTPLSAPSSGHSVLERFLRAALARRTDFTQESISKIKLQIV